MSPPSHHVANSNLHRTIYAWEALESRTSSLALQTIPNLASQYKKFRTRNASLRTWQVNKNARLTKSATLTKVPR